MPKQKNHNFGNFLVASTAASFTFVIAFVCCWAIPVHSAFAAASERKNNKNNFVDAYINEYNKSLYKLAQKPVNTYSKYWDLADIHRQKYAHQK